MLGLRLAEGVSARSFEARHGVPLRTWGGPALERLEAAGLVQWLAGSLSVPEEHWFVLHGILAEFVAAGG